MELERRFVFRGNAAPISGQIYRPEVHILEAGGASSLTVAGGVSRGSLEATRFGRFASIVAARTAAQGTFANRDQAVTLTHHKLQAHEVPTRTSVEVEVTGLHVGGVDGQPVLRVKRLAAALEGASPRGSENVPIRPRGLDVSGVSVDDFALDVEIDEKYLATHDTHEKLATAISSARDAESRFILRPDDPASRQRPDTEYPIYGSVVRGLKWRDRAYPGSRIDGHSLIIPELGRLFFGEIFVSSFSRRLTMLRLDLGSPVGGYMALAEVETNGSWYPPIQN